MSKHVIIIGGGIIGLTTAYYCQRDGHQVTIVERDGPEHDCCARGNAGMIVPSHFVPLAAPGMVTYGLRVMNNPRSPFHIRPRLDWRLADWGMNFMTASTEERVAVAAPVLRDLSLASRSLFVELSRESDFQFGLRQNGLLMLCRDHETLLDESRMAERAHELGVQAQVLSPEDTATLESGIDMDIAGSVYFPQDCHLDPAKLLNDLSARLRENGATFRWNCPVNHWDTRNGQIQSAITSEGRIEGDEFVIAGGAHSPWLADRLGLHLPMQAGKGYSLTVPTPPQRPKICCILTEARVAVTPIGRQLRFGGTMEIAGNDRSISTERVQGIIESATRYFPAIRDRDFAGVAPWTGLRPCSPDGLPYIGRTSRANNLIVATGHAMLGLSLAPVTGHLVASLVANRSSELDSALLSPDRYLGF